MKLFDAHCHMQDDRFADDIDSVLARAAQNGVQCFECCATSENDWALVLSVAARHGVVLPSIGIHPWFTDGLIDGWPERLVDLLVEQHEAGVGEIGLDHALNAATHERQLAVFSRQIEIARELRRPASIHCRRAWGAMLDVLKRFGNFPAGFVIHSYSGSVELINDIVGMGGYISFSGSVTRSGNKRARKSVVAVPADRLLLETDSPDMMPIFRNEYEQMASVLVEDRNEPMTLPVTVKAVAELRRVSVEDIGRIAFENGEKVFCGI